MRFKTEEVIYGQLDVVLHPTLLEAVDWMKNGIDVKLFQQTGGAWVESGAVKLEFEPIK